MTQFNKFEEYKLFIEDTARFTERRMSVTNIYITVNSILLSAVALLLNDNNLQNILVVLAPTAILIAGIAICLFWRQQIIKYKLLVGLRIDELRKMETSPEMIGCHQMYHAEDKLFPRDEKEQIIKGKALNFSDLEKRLPEVFIVLYGLFILGILVVWTCVSI